jgi:integrase
MALSQPIRDAKLVGKLLGYYIGKNQTRNQVLVAITLHSALRISDILRLRTDDVYDFKNNLPRESIVLSEKKTGKTKIVALHKNITNALCAYITQAQKGKPLILNPDTGKAISRIQAYRIINEASYEVGITHKVGCHSLRKTFGYHSWVNGISPVVLMEIYNHSSYAVTKRYLGVSQDDQNTAYYGLLLIPN